MIFVRRQFYNFAKQQHIGLIFVFYPKLLLQPAVKRLELLGAFLDGAFIYVRFVQGGQINPDYEFLCFRSAVRKSSLEKVANFQSTASRYRDDYNDITNCTGCERTIVQYPLSEYNGRRGQRVQQRAVLIVTNHLVPRI